VATRDELDQWLKHLRAHAVPNCGITDCSEPFPYAVLVLRDPDHIQLEVTWS
jgi:glyoxylase I family protein